MPLATKTKQALKAKAHKLKPIVAIGNNGFTDNIKKELERCLYDHELIKVRIQETDREIKKALFAEICVAVTAEPIQLIGNIGVIYRKSSKE
jgi:RNA-binding protein